MEKISLFSGDSEFERKLGERYDLNVTADDLARFDHYTGEDKQFLVTFIMRWRNKALDKTRASLQMAFHAILAKVKAVKIEEQRKEREELQRRSLEIFGTVKPGKRSEKEVEEVSSWLSRMRLGGEKLSNLNQEQMNHMANEMDLRVLPANSLVFLQGDPGDYYYWVISGEVQLYTAFTAAKELKLKTENAGGNREAYSVIDVSTLGNYIASMEDGDGFGELSIISDATRSLSAATSSETVLGRFTTTAYNNSIRSMHSEKMDTVKKISLMRKIKLFESWPPSALTHLSYKMQTKEHSYNDKIVLMGEAVREIYLIVDGDISLTSKVKIASTNVLDVVTYRDIQLTTIHSGSILGDIETTVDKSKSWRVTATVKSSTCTLLKIEKEDFMHLVLNSPDSIGDKIRMGAEAVVHFRQKRLREAQRMLVKEKKTVVDAANSESKTATRLRNRVQRASFDSGSGSNRPKISRADGRRKNSSTYGAGELDELQREVVSDLNSSPDPAVSPTLPRVLTTMEGGRRPSYSRRPSLDRPPTSKAPATVNQAPPMNPYNLPGLRNNTVATSPASLRRLQSRSMGAAPRLENPSGNGFAHYSASLQASFGDFQTSYARGKNKKDKVEPGKVRKSFGNAKGGILGVEKI